MTPERKIEIKNKAREINTLSENFQLAHATYAVQEYIKSIVKDFYQIKMGNLKVRIEERISKDLDTKNELEEKIQLEQLIKRNRSHIDIGYIDVSDSDIARVVKIDNDFTIYLSKALKDDIFEKISDDNQDINNVNYKIIKKIRKLMSHELGHLVLHTKDLLLEESLQGSLNVKEQDKEDEADLFGEQLLELRRKRNEKIKADGGAENLY